MKARELLGLRWQDVDFDNGYLHIRHQHGRNGSLKGLKSAAGERDVVLFPEVASLLRKHKAHSRFSQPPDYVFASAKGTTTQWSSSLERNLERTGG